MAQEMFLSLGEWFNYLNATPNSRNVVEGEAVLNSKHILLCGIDATKKNTEELNIFALVLQTTHLQSPPHQIKGTLKLENEICRIGTFRCSCKAGLGGTCKHISAVLLQCTRTNIYKFEQLTSTSLECLWNKREKASALEQYIPRPLLSFPCLMNKNEPTKTILTSKETENFKKIVLEKLPNSAFSIHKTQHLKQNVIEDDNHEQNKSQIVIDKIFEIANNSNSVCELYNFDIPLLQQCCISTYNSQIVQIDEKDICLKSMYNKSIWHSERQFRITASRCYSLYTYGGVNWTEKAQKYFFPKSFRNKFTEHGVKYEKQAKEVFKKKMNVDLVDTGLIVCRREPWLACTPDGIVLENGIPKTLVEIKCPYAGKEVTAADTINKCAFLKISGNGCVELKRKHSYYGQIQLSLAILNLKQCDLIIYAPFDKSYVHIKVKKDKNFIMDLLTKLKQIYFLHMLHMICQKDSL